MCAYTFVFCPHIFMVVPCIGDLRVMGVSFIVVMLRWVNALCLGFLLSSLGHLS